MKKVMIALLMAGGLLVHGLGCKDDAKGGEGKSGDSTGVPECDEYIKKYEGCLGKMPAAAKGPMEEAFKATREGFKTSASTPEGKTALKGTCKTMTDALASNPACK